MFKLVIVYSRLFDLVQVLRILLCLKYYHIAFIFYLECVFLNILFHALSHLVEAI